MAVVLSARADAELELIFSDTIARWGEAQARRYAQKLERRIAVLHTVPTAGRARPDLGDGVRSIPAGSHIVFFKMVDNGVLILSIRHARRRDPQPEDLE